MCTTTAPSRMSGTILYAAETTHNDKLLHVMGYQNRAVNLGSGPNAMLLPIPSAVPMGPGNAVDMTSCKNVLKDYEKVVLANKARRRGMSKGFGADSRDMKSVQVFDSGSYTIVLASNPNYINTALEQVPVNRRPKPNPAIFQAYSKLYPGWHVALCCFDGSVEAEPMVWQYEPLDPSHLFAPALDGHDGNTPNLTAQVNRDHTVIVSLVKSPKLKFAMERTASTATDVIPETHKHLFGDHFFGAQAHESSRNGDISIPIADIQGPYYLGKLPIVSPPGA